MASKHCGRFSRRDFWKLASAPSLIGFNLALANAGAAAGEIVEDVGGPAPPSDEVVLFPFDDFSIPLRYRLQIGLVSASDAYGLHTQRVLGKGKPGTPDAGRILFYGSVIGVGDELRMWYPAAAEDNIWRVCYAVSKDGINWTKPALGLVKFGGNTQNNLVEYPGFKGRSYLVLHEPDDPEPGRRFKMVYEVSPFQIGAGFSADGLHWRDSPYSPILKHNSLEPGGLTRIKGCYVLNGQGGNVGAKRPLVSFLSYDFDHWTDAVVVGMRRDVAPHRLAEGAHAGEQVHEGAALWNRGNVLVGAYGQWHGESNDRRFVSIDLGLVVSNDAVHFREPIPDFKLVSGDESLLPEDQETAVPAGKLNPGQAFANVGERTLFWYAPWTGSHVWAASWVRDRLGYFQVVGSSTPSAERLALDDTHNGAQAAFNKMIPTKIDPHFISCPLRVQGQGMRVFINAGGVSDQCPLKVTLTDERFHPLPGYGDSDSIVVTKPGLRQPVTWRSKQALEDFRRPFRIKVSWSGSRPEEAYFYALYVSSRDQPS